MRTLTFLFLGGLLAGATQAQDLFPERPATSKTPQQPEAAYGSDNALGRMLKDLANGKAFVRAQPLPGPFPKFGSLRPNTFLMLDEGPKVCAVRLLEAPLPSDTNFRMPQIRPPDTVDPMAEAKVPAPACPDSPR